MMKKIRSRCLAGLVLGAAVMLSACGVSRIDAATFIQGELDTVYRGVYSEDYLNLVEDMTRADAEEKYQSNVSAEAEYLLYYFLGVEYPDDAVTAKAESLIKEIYSHAQYTVGEADKLQSGDFVVEVTLSPIEIMPLLPEESYSENWQAACAEKGITTQEELNNVSEEEYAAIDAVYAMSMLEAVEELLPQLDYGTDQEIMLQLELGDDNYYSLVEEDWQHLDGVVIDYYGDYAK